MHDPIFKNYIQTFKDKWDDGKDINWIILADKAIQKYKALHEAGIWKSTDAQKQQIMVLTSVIQSMTKVMGHTPHPKKPQDGPKNAVRGAPEYAAWKSIPPTTDEPNEMQKGTRSYYWCLNHGSTGMWVAHKPADCKGHHQEKTKGADGDEEKKTTKSDLKPNGGLKAALTAFNKALSWTDICSSDEESDF